MLVAMVCSTAALCADQPQVAILPCPTASNCSEPSRQDIKKAELAFSRGLKLQRNKKADEAFHEFEDAAHLVPRNVNYLTARELSRQQLVLAHLERGNDALTGHRPVEALGEFRAALSLDPQNEFAQQRVQDAMGEWAPQPLLSAKVADAGGEVLVEPAATQGDFHFRGDSRALLTQVAATFGIKVTLDESVPSRTVRFDLGGADFYTGHENLLVSTQQQTDSGGDGID
jgi:tetratricopeptide (TPR) repeat protein